ncbi:MAG: signal peptidase II [Candidatus Woesearchaeota archaeon]
MNKNHAFFITSVVTIILDQLTKYLIKTSFQLNESIKFLPFFSISHVINYGAGFSILQGWRWFLIAFTIAVIGYVIYNYKKIPNKVVAFFVALIFGGAIGNLIDRIIYGYVVDFISFSFWPSFNIADSAITIGAIGLIAYYWKE